ncbi:hypothetical protein FACS189426_06180 [Bacteroidia bacterium]|nr:hypothetical protein FACS189426_06180 [Bacteroidia bacterium]GHV71240.1 hypothetical protein FACS189420_5600 [Bacteroidia bacterium]
MATKEKAKSVKVGVYEYAIIDKCLVNQDCDVVCKMGCVIATLKMPSPAEIEQELKTRIPGCTLHGKIGRAQYPTTIRIPAIGALPIECEEIPINDWENGWETEIIIG